MKKKFFSVLAILMLALVLPISVQAASITADKDEMNVNDIVEIKVTTTMAESIQFDVKFDNTKYEYVPDSAKSELTYTASNLIATDTVRVSALDLGGKKTDTVALKFKAIAEGTAVQPFNIDKNSIETDGVTVTLTEQVKIRQILAKKDEVVGGGPAPFVNDAGQVITALPQTGSGKARATIASIAGKYANLNGIANAVPYALPSSDDTLTIEDIRAEFESASDTVVTTATTPVKTGDTFYLSTDTATIYTVLIYGDVNRDGKVTTYDALLIYKNKGTTDPIIKEVADVHNDGVIDEKDCIDAVQKYILKLNLTDTVIDEYPAEIFGVVTTSALETEKLFRYEEPVVATVKAATGSTELTDKSVTLTYIIEAPNGDTESVCEYEQIGSSDTYNVKLYATTTGTYKVTPVITGNKVKGGAIKGDTITVTIEEVYTVSYISLSKNNNLVGKNIDFKIDTTSAYDIVYYHTYTTKAGDTIDVQIPNNAVTLNSSKVILNNGNNTHRTHLSEATLYAGEDDIKYNEDNGSVTTLTTENIDSIVLSAYTNGINGLKPAVAGDPGETLQIKIINDSKYASTTNYTANITEEIVVKVVNNNTKAGIKLNSQNPQGAQIALYTDATGAPANVVEQDGLIYTMFDISAFYSDNTTYQLYKKDIAVLTNIDTPNFITFSEGTEGDPYDTEAEMDITIKAFNKEGATYSAVSSATAPINYIGFALNLANVDIDVDYLIEKGIDVYYDTVAGRTSAHIGVIIGTVSPTNLLSLEPEEVEEEAVPEEEIVVEEPVIDEEAAAEDPETDPEEVAEPEEPTTPAEGENAEGTTPESGETEEPTTPAEGENAEGTTPESGEPEEPTTPTEGENAEGTTPEGELEEPTENE